MAYDIRSQNPYLSDNDWNTYKNDPAQIKNLNDFRKTELVDKLENFSLSENTFNEEIPIHSDERDDLRLVIIGKTGQGKSATANTILGKVRFEEDFTTMSVTRESRYVTEVVDGRKISVMDTPGFQGTHQSNESILKELARMTEAIPNGVHAFVYVMSMADPHFTAEDKNVLDLIEKTFGGGFKNYCLLAYSHGDSALKDVNLDTYRKKQMAIGQATSRHPTTQNGKKDQSGQDQDQKSLANLLGEISWKMLAIDNKTSIPFEKAHYRTQIVAMVDRMRISNNPEIYTNDMFVKAQQQREAMRQKGLIKGWNQSIMSKVEAIIAANPNITRAELEVAVSRQMEEESVNEMLELQRKEEEFGRERIAEEKRLQEQKRVDEEKREAEEKERRKRQEKENQERKDRFQKEERERQERRGREDRGRQLRQEQQEAERQKRIQREEIERQRRVAKEQEKHAQQIQLQKDQWEKRKSEEEEESEMLQQGLLDKQCKEYQQRSQEIYYLRTRGEEESRRMMQIERVKVGKREQSRSDEIELEKRLSVIKTEDVEGQMKTNEDTENMESLQRAAESQSEVIEKEHRLISTRKIFCFLYLAKNVVVGLFETFLFIFNIYRGRH